MQKKYKRNEKEMQKLSNAKEMQTNMQKLRNAKEMKHKCKRNAKATTCKKCKNTCKS